MKKQRQQATGNREEATARSNKKKQRQEATSNGKKQQATACRWGAREWRRGGN
jgi:hypothetical protein